MNKSPIREAIEKKVVEAISPPKDKIKKPMNRLWLATCGFNLIYFFVDLVTALAVGYLTTWYYGALVFFAGILPMVLHEGLFSNPYASTAQRWISAAGFFLSVASALFVGILVVVINVVFDSTQTGKTLEAIAMSLLFGIAVVHGGLFAAYFFVDSGISALQGALRAMANNETKLREIRMSRQVAEEAKPIIQELEDAHKSGDGALVSAALKSISGSDFEIENPTQGRS